MADDITESAVRQWLRDHEGQAHCAGCIARDLQLSGAVVRVAMDDLAPRQIFARGLCKCGAAGLSYGWPLGGPRG
jgi:hypothetical protein